MNYFLIWIGVSVSLFVLTFVCFVAIMKMREVQDEIFRLHWSVRWICYGILFVGLILDTLLDWVVLTISFVELPFATITFNRYHLPSIVFRLELLSTARVIRHKYESTGWRQAQAIWWCSNFLQPFDKQHCEK